MKLMKYYRKVLNFMYEYIKNEMIKCSQEKQKIKVSIMHKGYSNFDYFCELSNNLSELTLKEFDDILNKICEECYFENLYYEIISPYYCQIYFSKSYR